MGDKEQPNRSAVVVFWVLKSPITCVWWTLRDGLAILLPPDDYEPSTMNGVLHRTARCFVLDLKMFSGDALFEADTTP